MQPRFDYLMLHDSRPLTDWEAKCKSQILLISNNSHSTFTMEEIPYFENIVETIAYADQYRFDWLSVHPDGVYVDSDCFLETRFFPSVKGVPYFAKNYAEESIDIFLIYCNGCPDFFEQTFNAQVKQDWISKNIPISFHDQFYSWPLPLLKEIKEVGIIPSYVYKHKYQTTQAETKRRVEMEGTRTVNDIVNEELLKIDLQRGQERDFILRMRNDINNLAVENVKLKKEIEDFKLKMKELIP